MKRTIPVDLPRLAAVDPATLATLARADARGVRELVIGGAYTLAQAAGLALQLPPVTDADADAPTGWGVFPPRDFGPSVLARPGVRDARGNPVPTGRHGVVCCLWRSPRSLDRVVHRLSFPGDASTPALHPVDVYDDQIERELGLSADGPDGKRALPFAHPGWCLARLDPSPEDRIAHARKAAIDRRLGNA